MNLDFDPNKDYYSILWVSENASQEEIKKAFRKLAMQYHPDRAPEDKKKEYEQKFKEINEAYQVLWDENKRKQYDAFRKWGFGWFDFWQFSSWGFGSTIFDMDDIFDVFNDFFGTWFWRWEKTSYSKVPQRGEDILVNVEINFEEAYRWIKKQITYNRYVICNNCWWKWVEKDNQRIQCPVCWWKWYIVDAKRTPFWVFQTQIICSKCWGSWYIDTKICKVCNWTWRILKTETVEINIPAGVKNGTILKIPWMWHYGLYGWDPWDLLIKVIVKPSDKWQRSWYDIITTVPISVYDAVLGWEIEVEHPNWKIKVKIPKWLQIWDKIIVSWKWFKKSWWIFPKYWDLVIIPKIQLPKKLSREEEKLWRKLKEISYNK
jgi:molecular chaperone DnaJ